MNKSLVLVMCDVLVLSAMSLSTGNFESLDDGDRFAVNPPPPSDPSGETDNRIEKLEAILSDTSNRLTLVSRDLVETNRQLRLKEVAVDSLAKDLDVALTNYGQASNDIQDLKYFLGTASNELVLASRELLNLSNALHTSAVSIDALSNKYVQVINELSGVRTQLDGEIGVGYTKRISLIETCKYGLYIENAKKREMYYSPLIRVGTNILVMAYMPRENVSRLGEVVVMEMNGESVGTVDSVWGLSGGYDKDIILFKLNVPSSVPALSLGGSQSGPRDH